MRRSEMAYTEYLFDAEEIREKTNQYTENLKRNLGLSDLTANGVKVISDRLREDPRRYRDYGPYWPALKAVMLSRGYGIGDRIAPEIAAVYHGSNDAETIVMAEEFRNYYLDTFFVYANKFMLNEDGEEWILYDPAYERLAALGDEMGLGGF